VTFSLGPVVVADLGTAVVTPPVAAAASHWAVWSERLRPLAPIPALAVVLFLIWLFFRQTWRELDFEAHHHRGEMLAEGKLDVRPLVAMAMVASILTVQEYYGGRGFYEESIRPHLVPLDERWHGKLGIFRFDELYGFGWWAFARVFGYVLPFPLWKIFFPRDSILDMGLRTKGFLRHAWIYCLFLACVLPAMFIVSHQPDFGSYYPFYRQASRSWLDFLMWEGMYFAQFFALEMFFRGFFLGALKTTMGSGAIFAMAVPYCMIHYGKPYLEVFGAIAAGCALGSLSMRTKSIYQGFLVHITVAGLMDWLALHHRHALPTVFWPPHG
jgi:membrane protease YdiL (CAAX protease family)